MGSRITPQEISMIDKKTLQKLYQKDKKSTYEIASILGCSSSKVLRWMKKYDIKPRDISKDIIGKEITLIAFDTIARPGAAYTFKVSN